MLSSESLIIPRENPQILNTFPFAVPSSTPFTTVAFWEQHSSGHHMSHHLHLQSVIKKQTVLLRRKKLVKEAGEDNGILIPTHSIGGLVYSTIVEWTSSLGF